MAAEAIGLAASIATLSKIVKVTADLFKLIHDAPEETRRVARELDLLVSQAILVREVHSRLKVEPGDCDLALGAFEQHLSYTVEDLGRITARLTKIVPTGSHLSKLRWAVIGKEDAAHLLRDLNATRSALTMTLNLALCLDRKLSFVETPKQPYEFESMKSQNRDDYILANRPTNEILTPPMQHTHTSTCLPYSEIVNLEASCLGQSLSLLLGNARRERHTEYGLSFVLTLPFACVIAAKLFIRSYDTNCMNFAILRGSSLCFSNRVEEDCSFFDACLNGDICKMQYMLKNRLASPNDTTDTGLTPMTLAIRGGSFEAVQLLINEGVDVDTLFGRKQTSPLANALMYRHQDIARLLLQCNASCTYISGYGWPPLFNLWAKFQQAPESAVMLIDMLSARPDFYLSHYNILDVSGFGVIHRATIFGHPDDVVRLIQLGVSPYTTQGPLEWNAMQNAVFYNRYDVFEVLLPYFNSGDNDINMTDSRGWTLLHISASEGHDSITRHLLRLGADWKVLTQKRHSDMAESLYGGRWTPAQVALGEGGYEDGQRRYELFVHALRDIKGVDDFDAEDDNADTVWIDAHEELPLP